ncbi:hypothetical protein [uncultured Megasphaera sp.]|uniref:hypothetical protein n=1 Tax=uncultured Megasphaera sp. TaxID=165188 RepID=UPI0025DD3A62|nr:hypothetical protein [uncultured Megasphaera sp.]
MNNDNLIASIKLLAENLEGQDFLDDNDVVILLANIKGADMSLESINGNAYYIATHLMHAVASLATAYGEQEKQAIKEYFIKSISNL